MKWSVIKLPFEAGENDFYNRKEGDILWNDHFTNAEIQEIKSDTVTFSALFQQEPQPFEGGFFSEEWLNYFDPSKMDSDRLNRYIVVDPALSTKSTGNYTAIIVFGLGEDRNYYVLDMFRDRVDPYERADALFRLVRKWRPIKVGYEQYGMVADIPYLKERMDRSSYHFTLVELGKSAGGGRYSLSKKDRIRQLIPLFREGRIWLPKYLNFVDSAGNDLDLVSIFIDKEYKHYPSVTNDDLLDDLSRITDDAMKLEWPESQEEYDDASSDSGGSWLVG